MNRVGTYLAYAAFGIAVVALVLSVRASSRGDGAAAGAACVDQRTRDRVAALERMLGERDATIARLARAVNASVPAASVPAASPPADPAPAPDDNRVRRFARFETSNPAVTVTQKPDGTFDVRTTDPSLAGQVLVVTAVTDTGEEAKMYVRVP